MLANITLSGKVIKREFNEDSQKCWNTIEINQYKKGKETQVNMLAISDKPLPLKTLTIQGALDCHKDDNSNKIPLVRVYQFTLDEVEPEEIEPVF
jgi:hypothetical protein